MYNLNIILRCCISKYFYVFLLFFSCLIVQAKEKKTIYKGPNQQKYSMKLVPRGLDLNYALIGTMDSTFIFDPAQILNKMLYKEGKYSVLLNAIEIGASNIKGIQLNSLKTPKFIITLSNISSINLYDGISYDYELMSDTVKMYDMHELSVANYRNISCLFKNFSGSYNRIEVFQVNNSFFSERFDLDHSSFQTFFLEHSKTGSFHFVEISVKDAMTLNDCSIQKDSYISGYIGNSLCLKDVTFESNATLDLRYCHGTKGAISLSLQNVPIENIFLDWRNFKLDSATRSDYISCKIVYKRLMENFSKHFQNESYELIDKEYQHYRYLHVRFLGLGWLFDRFIWLWWDYGYGGWQVILWMILLPLLWALIIYKQYDQLNLHVYCITNFVPFLTIEPSRPPKRTYRNALIYASIIFFAISLKLENLKFERHWLLVLFLTIYLNGLCCMYFLVNYLLKS